MFVLLVATFGSTDAAPPCGAPAGNSFYVSPATSNTNGCTLANPCREIRNALTLVQAGDTIYVADGVYLGFTAQSISGNATNPITIKAQGTNAYVFATTDRDDNRDNIFITFCQWLVIDGLNSTNAPRAGMRIDSSPHITVRNGRFGNNGTWGIFTDFSDDTVLANNECYGSIAEHGIYISNSSDRPVLRNNRCHDNARAGIHMNGDESQGGDGLITGALVENNIIYNNGSIGAAGINMDGVQDSIVRNNVLYNNHATGIAMYQDDGAAGPKNNLVAHNTIDQASDGRWALLVWNSAGANTVRNNILHNRHPSRGGINLLAATDAASIDTDYNAFGGNCTITTNDDLIITLAQWQGLGHDTHSFCSHVTNLVVNALVDYHLKTNSPTINAGQTLGAVLADIDHLARPTGAASDIGAYEFGAILTAPVVILTLAGADACISFPTFIGKLYSVESRNDLVAGMWTTFTNNVPGTGDLFFVSDPGGTAQTKRFYRVHITP